MHSRAGRVAGKVALITGAAKGQGRSHAVRLAEEGADIIAVDICAPLESESGNKFGTPEDLAETVKAVEHAGGRIVPVRVDVADKSSLVAAVDEAVSTLGRLDVVVANAGGGGGFGRAEELSDSQWQSAIDVNLLGVRNTCQAAIPHIRAGKRGGSIMITSSGAGLKGVYGLSAYVATKHAGVGLMKALATELADEMIRVNAIAPTTVNTDMIHSKEIYAAFRPDLENPGLDDVVDIYKSMNLLPVPWVEPVDISNAVLFLASDEARYITGVSLPVDAGFMLK